MLSGEKRWAVVRGDCTKVLAALPDKSVASVVTDPPYLPVAMKNARGNGETMKKRRDGKVYDFGYSALTSELRYACSAEFARIATRWILVWCDIEGAHFWRTDMVASGARYIRTGIWVRVNSAPQFSGDRPAQGVETCVIAHAPKSKLRWNGGGSPATWVHPIVSSQDPSREHSTPKPLALMLEQIEQFTNPDDLVVDAFCGSGTTGVACVRLGRRFIGIERDAKFARGARERLRAESVGLDVLAYRAKQISIFEGIEVASCGATKR